MGGNILNIMNGNIARGAWLTYLRMYPYIPFVLVKRAKTGSQWGAVVTFITSLNRSPYYCPKRELMKAEYKHVKVMTTGI